MAKAKDYQTVSIELDEVLDKLQQPDIQVDEAVKLYELGLELINQLEERLTLSENKIEKLKLSAEVVGEQ